MLGKPTLSSAPPAPIVSEALTCFIRVTCLFVRYCTLRSEGDVATECKRCSQSRISPKLNDSELEGLSVRFFRFVSDP